MVVGWHGFQGFQPSETRPPPALKPGETLQSRDTKFQNSAPGSIDDLPKALQLRDRTASSSAGIVAAPARKVPLAKMHVRDNKPCSKMTTSRAAYVDPGSVAKRVQKPAWLEKEHVAAEQQRVHARHFESSYQIDMCSKDNLRGRKSSSHIPGYSGYLPKNGGNLGRSPRPPYCYLRMYHSHDVPGYTGWRVANAKNDRGPRLSGCDPKTSSGASGEILLQ